MSAVTFGYELILSCSIEDFFKLNFIEKELIPMRSAVMDDTMNKYHISQESNSNYIGKYRVF